MPDNNITMGNNPDGFSEPGFAIAQEGSNYKEMMHPFLMKAKPVVDDSGRQTLQIRMPIIEQQQFMEWTIGRAQITHRKYLFLP